MNENNEIDAAYIETRIGFDILGNPISEKFIHISFKHFWDAKKMYSIFEPYLKNESLITNMIKGYVIKYIDIPNDLKITDMTIKNGFTGWGCELILKLGEV